MECSGALVSRGLSTGFYLAGIGSGRGWPRILRTLLKSWPESAGVWILQTAPKQLGTTEEQTRDNAALPELVTTNLTN